MDRKSRITQGRFCDTRRRIERVSDNVEERQFAVCGGLVIAIHGDPQATEVIDIIIRKENLNEVLEVPKSVGFEIPSSRMPLKATTPVAMEIYSVSKAVDQKLKPLDLMLMLV